jgi:hypothetical protein
MKFKQIILILVILHYFNPITGTVFLKRGKYAFDEEGITYKTKSMKITTTTKTRYYYAAHLIEHGVIPKGKLLKGQTPITEIRLYYDTDKKTDCAELKNLNVSVGKIDDFTFWEICLLAVKLEVLNKQGDTRINLTNESKDIKYLLYSDKDWDVTKSESVEVDYSVHVSKSYVTFVIEGNLQNLPDFFKAKCKPMTEVSKKNPCILAYSFENEIKMINITLIKDDKKPKWVGHVIEFVFYDNIHKHWTPELEKMENFIEFLKVLPELYTGLQVTE